MSRKPATRPKPAPKTKVLRAALAAALIASPALAGPVGQTWRAFPDASAASRDYLGRAQVRAVVWYPAAGAVAAKPITIGPPGAETFSGGQAAPEAPVAKGRHPLIVMSHGSGGTALQYGWLGSALAGEGYIVIAVDHPGASGGERATDAGTLMWWRRADDITAAIDAALKDPTLGSRIDRKRIGMVGYSLGGATGLLLAGGKVDLAKMQAACVTAKNAACGQLGALEGDLSVGRSDPRIAAYALIAPGLVSSVDLSPIGKAPALVVAGDADTTAAPAENAAPAAKAMAARLELLPGVAHNDFLQVCTDAGRGRYAELCKEPNAQREATHAKAAGLIVGFFESTLKAGR